MANGRGRKDRRAARRVAKARRTPPDIFGLEREYRISATVVRKVFTPHQPVSAQSLLFGRQREVQTLVQTINTPGQHVLLYGERGVGKSSLANVVALVVEAAMGRKIYRKRCDSSDTFETIVRAPLADVGVDLSLVEVSSSNADASKKSLGIGGINLSSEKAREIVSTYRAMGEVSPASTVEAIKDLEGLLIVDEADSITGAEDRRKLAELIKHLSDESSNLKIMVVGIARTGDELTAAHPSVQRCLRETKLRRMSDSELREIVTSGASVLRLEFKSEVISSIVRLSDGYPHFTHLIALKCAEEAIAGNRVYVDKDALKAALKLSVTDAEGTLRRVYEESVRSSSDMYRVILTSAATIGSEEFSAADLRKAIAQKTGEEVSQNSLNNYYQKLISADGHTIIRRTAHGYYRFEDPRMASFIRIANEML
jgi:Cdc6-like AAA superfamily ATPase